MVNNILICPHQIKDFILLGSIKTAVKFDSHICMLSITSRIANEIRLLKISSTHILSNHLPMQIQVVYIAVPDTDDKYDFPNDFENAFFTVPPHQQRRFVYIFIKTIKKR